MFKRQKFATTSLVWGIIGAATGAVFGIGLLPCAISIIFGLIAILNPNHAKGRAIAGLCCSAVGIILAATVLSQLN